MQIILQIGMIVLFGILLGHFVKRLKLPSIAGYVIAGIIVGPSVLGLVPSTTSEILTPISNLALAFLAFSVGTELFVPVLKKDGIHVLIIAVVEVLVTWALVTGGMYLLGLDFYVSLMLGALASSTSPAPILMIKKQFGYKSKFINNSVTICALDDAIGIVVFGIAKSIVKFGRAPGAEGTFDILEVTKPAILEIGVSIFFGILIGAVLGLVINLFVKSDSDDDNGFYLEMAFVAVIFSLALSYYFEASTILVPLLVGFVYTNVINKNHFDRTTAVVDLFDLPFLIVFFTLAGLQIDLGAISVVWFLGLAYVLFRGIGKYFGGFAGGIFARQSKDYRKKVGIMLLPLGGVEIGLALSAQEVFTASEGNHIKLIVLTSTLIYSIFGTFIVSNTLRKNADIK